MRSVVFCRRQRQDDIASSVDVKGDSFFVGELANRPDPLALFVDRKQISAGDYAVLEIDPDRTCVDDRLDVFASSSGSTAYPPSKSSETGRSTALTIRSRFSITNSSGIFSPSANPFAAATAQLPVATALAPTSASAFRRASVPNVKNDERITLYVELVEIRQLFLSDLP